MPKYTFDTKFSELMKDERVVKLAEEFCPELMSHPLKNMALAMGMTPNMAMPFFSKMYAQEKIEAFRQRIESLE